MDYAQGQYSSGVYSWDSKRDKREYEEALDKVMAQVTHIKFTAPTLVETIVHPDIAEFTVEGRVTFNSPNNIVREKEVFRPKKKLKVRILSKK